MAREKKKKRLGLWITLGIFITIVLLLVGSLVFVEISINNLSDSMATSETQVYEAYDARSLELTKLEKILKSGMSLDPELFTDLKKADQELKNAVGVKAKSEANLKVDTAIDKIFFVMRDKYPHLNIKVDESGIDEAIDTARSRIVMKSTDYNKTAKDYNAAIENFPGDFMASVFDHQSVDIFQIVDYDDIAD